MAATPPRSHAEPPRTPPHTTPPNSRATAHATALGHALDAAELGYAVLPLTRAELPAVRSAHRGHPASPPCRGACGRIGHGVHDATSDPLEVRRLFAAAPWTTGYGIACGLPPHHLIGIDLDVKNGADALTALRLIAAHHHFPLPPTLTVQTPGGGRHLWLTTPPSPPAPPVPHSAGRLAPGIGIRSTGGYLAGPGSLTSRGRYALAPGTPLHPAPAPRALLTLLAADPSHPPHPAPALVRFVRTSPVGQRTTRLFWAACRAHEAGLGPELHARLTEAAHHTGLTERETRTTLRSAALHTTTPPT